MENCKKLMEELKKQVSYYKDAIHFLESQLDIQESHLKVMFTLESGIWPQYKNGLQESYLSPEAIEECKKIATMYCNAAVKVQARTMRVQKFVNELIQFSDELETDFLSLCLTETEKTDLQEFNSLLSKFYERICFNIKLCTQFIENSI